MQINVAYIRDMKYPLLAPDFLQDFNLHADSSEDLFFSTLNNKAIMDFAYKCAIASLSAYTTSC